MKAFMGFKKYFEWKKYKKVLARKSQNEYRLKMQKLCFQGWGKNYKAWKALKDQERFEDAVKREVQSISTQYAKEIETLNRRLSEANNQVAAANRSKASMEENLKKVFMKGVCAMNFEAMNVFGDSPGPSKIENEIDKQIKLASELSQQPPS